MDSLSALSGSTYTYPAAPAAPAAAGSQTGTSVSPAVSLELSSVQQQGQLTSLMLGSLSSVAAPTSFVAGGTPDPSSLFADANTLSVLNAQGSAAMNYLTPQAPPAGQTINALA